MAGHSQWGKIKKAMFLMKASAITKAAKHGTDPKFNISLRKAIDDARAAGMPEDQIKAAIKKAHNADGEAPISAQT